jgi:hypothetical protein
MRPIHFWTKARVRTGASLTLLVIALCAPSSSRADCRHPGNRPTFALGIDAFRLDAPPADPASSPAPKPCDGPQCSGKSAPPMTPAPQGLRIIKVFCSKHFGQVVIIPAAT